MSNQNDEPDSGIADEDLPDELQPSEDNPLAEPLDEDAPSPEELDVLGGKRPEQSGGDTEDTDEADDTSGTGQ